MARRKVAWMERFEDRPFGVDEVVHAIYRCILFADAALAMAILAGGTTRFPFPTYQPLLELSDGHAWPWGVSIGAAAILLAVHNRVANFVGLALSFLWMNLFSAMFAVAIVQYPAADSVAPIPYATLAVVHVALLTLKVVEYRASRGS